MNTEQSIPKYCSSSIFLCFIPHPSMLSINLQQPWLLTFCFVLPAFPSLLSSTYCIYFSHSTPLITNIPLSFHLHPSLPTSWNSPLLLNTPLLFLSVILPPLVSVLLFLYLSSSSSFLDTSRVTWTSQIGVSSPLSTSVFPLTLFLLILLTIFYFFSVSLVLFLSPSLIY